jgi:glucosyl-3-phosphoglycerate synthase
MWRSLSVARGDIVMFADADTSNFREQFVYGTLGPLLTVPEVQFTKAAYRRPYTDSSQSVADGGGRVTELMAKPLFNFFCPELAGFVQPLAGEFAAYRDLLCSIPFLTGYGVELGIMVDVLEDAGLDAMAQVDLGARQNRHQPLWDLSLMSSAVLRAMASRASLPQRGICAPGTPGVRTLRRPEVYLHAVATGTGLRLDEHINELHERPPLAQIMPAEQSQDTVA